MANKVTNNDTGSLKVGAAGANLKKGDKIRIAGETADRVISYVMGAGEKTHVCTKGFGPFPLGEVEWEASQD
jgi:hypothetical protein